MYPRGHKDSVGKAAIFLSCAGSAPKGDVNFQLLIQNQDEEAETVTQGGKVPKLVGFVLFMCRLITFPKRLVQM